MEAVEQCMVEKDIEGMLSNDCFLKTGSHGGYILIVRGLLLLWKSPSRHKNDREYGLRDDLRSSPFLQGRVSKYLVPE